MKGRCISLPEHRSGQYSLVTGILVSSGESSLLRVVKLRGDILNAPCAEGLGLPSGVPIASVASTLAVSKKKCTVKMVAEGIGRFPCPSCLQLAFLSSVLSLVFQGCLLASLQG